MVPVGVGGGCGRGCFLFLATFFTAFFAAFFTAFFAAFLTAFFAAFFFATRDSPFSSRFAREGYQLILNLLQYQLSSRTRRACSSLRRCAMSLAASKASASPKLG